MKKDPPSRLAPSRLASSKRAPSKRAPSKRAPSKRAPSKRAPSKRAPSRLAPSNRVPARPLPVAALVLILASILAAIGGTVAIYTSQAFQRSVVRNRDTEAIRFSSDKLVRVSAGDPSPTCYYPLPEKNSTHTMTFRVCNYDQDKSTLFNENTITYDITFAVAGGTTGFDYRISGKNDGKNFSEPLTNEGEPLTLRHSLTGGESSYNSYTFTFDAQDYKNVQLTVTVDPSPSGDTNPTKGKWLKGILIPIAYADTQGINVRGEYPDRRPNTTPEDFAAYNYLVSISGGASDVKLTWPHTKLEIDPFFLEKVKPYTREVDDETKTSSIMFHMDPNQGTDAYLIQFYNCATTIPSDWGELGILVTKVGPDSE